MLLWEYLISPIHREYSSCLVLAALWTVLVVCVVSRGGVTAVDGRSVFVINGVVQSCS